MPAEFVVLYFVPASSAHMCMNIIELCYTHDIKKKFHLDSCKMTEFVLLIFCES